MAALAGTAPEENIWFQECLYEFYWFKVDLKTMGKSHNITLFALPTLLFDQVT